MPWVPPACTPWGLLDWVTHFCPGDIVSNVRTISHHREGSELCVCCLPHIAHRDSSGSNDSKERACGHFLLHLCPSCYFSNVQVVARELHLLPAPPQEKSTFLLAVIYVGGIWWACWSDLPYPTTTDFNWIEERGIRFVLMPKKLVGKQHE